MTKVLRLRRELVIGALFLVVGAAATLAIASGGHTPFRAHIKVIAAGCRSGFVAESDAAGAVSAPAASRARSRASPLRSNAR